MKPKKKHIIIKPQSSDKIGSGILYSHLPDSTFYGEVIAVSEVGCEGIKVGDKVKYNRYAPKIIDSEHILVKATDVFYIIGEDDKPHVIQDRIIISFDDGYKLLDSGIVLVTNDKPHLVWGVVEDIGSECNIVKRGMKILFPYGVSVKEEHKGEKCLLIRETDIYAVEEADQE
jgi:co-chaperonin GroES (HSP10)